MIHAGQRTEQVELLSQNPLHILAAERTDFVLGCRPGVETLADALSFFRRERESRFAAATIVESRQSLVVITTHPTLTNPPG
jgi:hypothetical protein